ATDPLHIHSFPTRRSSDLCHARSGFAEDLKSGHEGLLSSEFRGFETSLLRTLLQILAAAGDRQAPLASISRSHTCRLLRPERRRSEEHTSELQSPDHLVCR